MNLSFTPEGVVFAYCMGLFPMYDSRSSDILWYRPDPRAIIPLESFHVSRSLQKRMRRPDYEVRVDTDFAGVMRGCADRAEGTWISSEFLDLYGALHVAGVAHSVETWMDGRLVGGTYGLAIGGAFMAESMFHYATNASKLALAALVEHLKKRGYVLLDTQYLTPHLVSLGAVEIPHRVYLERLKRALRMACAFA